MLETIRQGYMDNFKLPAKQNESNKKLMNLSWNLSSLFFFLSKHFQDLPPTFNTSFRANKRQMETQYSRSEALIQLLDDLLLWTETSKKKEGESLLQSFSVHLQNLKSESKKHQFLKYFSDDKKYPVFKSLILNYAEKCSSQEDLGKILIFVAIIMHRKFSEEVAKAAYQSKSFAELREVLVQNEANKELVLLDQL